MRDVRRIHCAPFFGGYSFGAGRASKSTAVFDPATLSLSAWYRTDYPGSPWTSTASAGSSGSADSLTEATNPPGSFFVNGKDTADFDGTNDRLAASSCPFSDLTGTISFAALINFDAIANAINSANPYEDTCLFVDVDGAFGVAVADDTGTKKLRGFAYTGAAYDIVDLTTASFGTGAWIAIFAEYNKGATTFSGGTNNDTFASGTANGSYSFAGKAMRVGTNYNQTSDFLDGKVAELMWATSDTITTNRANIRSYFNSRYAVST